MRNFSIGILHRLGDPLLSALQGMGEFVAFCMETVRWFFTSVFRVRITIREMERIGVQSIWIIALVGAFSGMVFALQTGYAFRLFNAESLVGATVGIAVTRELAPVFTGLMVVSRACSAMAAEIGTMQVTEQVDALKALGVPPISYLVIPRVVATTIMMPFLCGIFIAISLAGSFMVAVYLLQIPESAYMKHFDYIVDATDIYQGLIKAFVFGILISLISCYKGYRATNGAEGVGKATTQAVVASSVTILISNYFIATWLLEIFPNK